MTFVLAVSLACGPGQPEDTLGSDAGDGDPGDGEPEDSNAGDGDPGDADGEATTNASGDGDPDPSGDGDPDPSGDGDPDATDCAALGFLMAHCDGVNFGCIDDWTCHFYDSVDIYGISPVGNCSPPCEVDADCGWVGQFGGMCSDDDIVCEPWGADGVPRCILPCVADGDCYSSQYCDEDLGLCLSNST
jgi:hypothetical protein